MPDHGRVGESRNDRVHPDSLGGIIRGHDPNEPEYSGLARAVGIKPWRAADEPGRRRSAHDRAAARSEHRADAVLAGEEVAGEVDVDDPPPDFGLKLVSPVVGA